MCYFISTLNVATGKSENGSCTSEIQAMIILKQRNCEHTFDLQI